MSTPGQASYLLSPVLRLATILSFDGMGYLLGDHELGGQDAGVHSWCRRLADRRLSSFSFDALSILTTRVCWCHNALQHR